MPEVRLDIEGAKLDRKKEELLTKVTGYQGILTLRLPGIPHTSFSVLIELPTDRIRVYLLSEILWHLRVIRNGGARILRAIASWIEFHLSPSYVLFNLKALSIVIVMNVALSERFLASSDIGSCFRR
jgi:hypothetical protein